MLTFYKSSTRHNFTYMAALLSWQLPSDDVTDRRQLSITLSGNCCYCTQVIRIRADLVSEARRADRSLTDLLSLGDVVRLTATTTNRPPGDLVSVEDEVVLAQPATLTISSPPSPATDAAATLVPRGKLNVLTYRGGRVDSTSECVPCAYDYTVKKRRVDIRVWQISAIGYVRRIPDI